MRKASVGLAAVCFICCVACGARREVNAYSPSVAFVDGLKEKARKLAESELARINKAEQAYKGDLVFEAMDERIKAGAGLYYKCYREYTRCSVADIAMQSSYLYPISYELDFEYRFMVTPPRHTDFPDSRDRAARDTNYEVFRTATLRQSYPCNPDGDPMALPPAPWPHESALSTPRDPEPASPPKNP